ncbi:MAG TPA: fasciclin domain-containing protein [Sphingomicrobium sp.]|nr:fasciclin domain-containing protein [Sphingomicrobium sp.]
MRIVNIRTSLAAAALILVAGCEKAGTNGDGNAPVPAEAAEAAGNATIADGIASSASDSKFVAATKSIGLDKTLAGPGPYTVLVPSDAAFDKLKAGSLDKLMKPESRAELTSVLTYHILPGTILVADIDKAIDNGKGKAVLATMNGATLTATKDGDKIVLTDAAGTKAVIAGVEDKRSNGAVHQIDAVLMPS